jgi:signal transduction histidine kinase
MPSKSRTEHLNWERPIFKVLANNDTGNAPGHQGGIVVPAALRRYFPPLSNSTSATTPTVDIRLKADLYCENQYLGTVQTRYQYQTWGGVRSPEARITDQLGPLRNKARGGDLLLIQRNVDDHAYYQLRLIRQTSDEFRKVAELLGGKRWGALEIESASIAVPFDVPHQIDTKYDEDTSSTPKISSYWGAVAFATRCAHRFADAYQNDHSEPASQRTTVVEAVSVLEHRVELGGPPGLNDVVLLDGKYFDNYDINSINVALYAAREAASYTLADLSEDGEVAPNIKRMLSAIFLTALAFRSAFQEDDFDEVNDVEDIVTLAVGWSDFGEPSIADLVAEDARVITEFEKTKSSVPFPPITNAIFPPLWPRGFPSGWPSQQLSFRPRARIIRTIGDKLISGPEAAVIELVKNSYDADASFVRISLIPNPDSSKTSIVFEDDGHGMSLEDIQQKWMEPATSDKRDRQSSAKGRRLLGSKGIGRFAAARLGRYLELISTAPATNMASSGTSQFLTTRIPELDWNAFEETRYLDDVKFPVETVTSASKTGTRLTISELRDTWSISRLKDLHEELRKLLSPIPGSTANGFHIYLDLSKCTVENSGFDGNLLFRVSSEGRSDHEPYLVQPFPLLEACDYAVDGIFDEQGIFSGSIVIQRGGLEPEEIKLAVPLKTDQRETSCGLVLVKLHIFDREADAIRSSAQKAGFGSIGVREARKLLDNISGVGIYREGFRIRPYGDEENDWLALDAKRVQNPTMKIGRNQIAGIVTIDDEGASGLLERSSREGLEENGSFLRLRNLIATLLSEVVEPRRRQFRMNSGLDSRKESSFKDIYEQVQLGWSKMLVAKIPEQDRAAAEQLITRETDKLKDYLKRLEARQAQLEAHATLGLIIGEVMHQGNTPLSFVETESSRLIKWWPSLNNGSEHNQKRIQEVPRILNGMASSSGKLRTLFNALSPLSGANRGDPVLYNALKTIEDTIYLFKTKFERSGIRIEVLNQEEPKAFGYADDLATAMTNLVDNAIYWLEYHHIQDPLITIKIQTSEKRCFISVADNGVGVPIEFSNQLFDVGFSLKPHGTGLGLSIAREAIFRSGGDIELLQSARGAEFKISLPSNNIK